MRILYAIQGTGNGHIARAIELVPEFWKYGEVDVLVSGHHSELKLPFPVKYRMNGYGFYFGTKGGIDLRKTWKLNSILSFFREVSALQVDQYDLVVSDFEPVSAWACWLKGKACFGLSHQLAVLRQNGEDYGLPGLINRAVMKWYAPVKDGVGFNFRAKGSDILSPVIRKKVRDVHTRDKGHYTVYLPSWSDLFLIAVLSEVRDVDWHVFSKNALAPFSYGNVYVKPVNDEAFVKSLAESRGVLCNAGFETPSEALFLGKKLCVVPMKFQYEQGCNADILEDLGVLVLRQFSKPEALPILREWVLSPGKTCFPFPDNASTAVEKLLSLAEPFMSSKEKASILLEA